MSRAAPKDIMSDLFDAEDAAFRADNGWLEHSILNLWSHRLAFEAEVAPGMESLNIVEETWGALPEGSGPTRALLSLNSAIFRCSMV